MKFKEVLEKEVNKLVMKRKIKGGMKMKEFKRMKTREEEMKGEVVLKKLWKMANGKRGNINVFVGQRNGNRNKGKESGYTIK